MKEEQRAHADHTEKERERLPTIGTLNCMRCSHSGISLDLTHKRALDINARIIVFVVEKTVGLFTRQFMNGDVYNGSMRERAWP